MLSQELSSPFHISYPCARLIPGGLPASLFEMSLKQWSQQHLVWRIVLVSRVTPERGTITGKGEGKRYETSPYLGV